MINKLEIESIKAGYQARLASELGFREWEFVAAADDIIELCDKLLRIYEAAEQTEDARSFIKDILKK